MDARFQVLIPADKSWVIRMVVLDLINQSKSNQFLKMQTAFSEDLLALKRVCDVWNTDEPLDVGESATIYRFLQFASWKLGLNKQFLKRGTLPDRKITNNPNIVCYTLAELLKLDNKTSQWASASVLLGNLERIENPPYKLKLTYEALNHWKDRREKGEPWGVRHDETIKTQAETFLKFLKGEKPSFRPEQAEDYCFARAFGFISENEGGEAWPSLVGHESNRITEMERVMAQANAGELISSLDHRVIQAVAMWGEVNKKHVRIEHPEGVNKSWPQFWDFLRQALKP